MYGDDAMLRLNLISVFEVQFDMNKCLPSLNNNPSPNKGFITFANIPFSNLSNRNVAKLDLAGINYHSVPLDENTDFTKLASFTIIKGR
jgi:hypothetical protein